MSRVIRVAVLLLAVVTSAILLRPSAERAYDFYRLVSADPPAILPIPVAGVGPGAVSNSWGNARKGGRKHEGIDIFAPRRTPVISTTRGLVMRKGTNGLGGRIVTVLGPGGHYHYYAHLEDWSDIAEWSWVEPGDVLGYVGNSGNAQGGPTHLHYAIYQPGKGAVNPFPFLVEKRPGGA